MKMETIRFASRTDDETYFYRTVHQFAAGCVHLNATDDAVTALGSADFSVTGTVTLTDDGRYVRQIMFSSTQPEPHMVRAGRIEITLRLADDGAPVIVERPETK